MRMVRPLAESSICATKGAVALQRGHGAVLPTILLELIRRRPGDVIRSRPGKVHYVPLRISRSLCSAGISGGGPLTGVSPTASSETNSSRVSISDCGDDGLSMALLQDLGCSSLLRSGAKKGGG